ncbi:hypothetical protein COMA1_20250 [Candidatus Nitrospira nitrosa]|uniref:Uncharacterized protein n=1 Tax=Candidatus Nitrospira nitrosa TaxID=1742972 RepID=A0A0S4LHG6_9BACT|nr:hypothetical protein COMA1_20250 [Candidatus Nitrospira nitrosa]
MSAGCHLFIGIFAPVLKGLVTGWINGLSDITVRAEQPLLRTLIPSITHRHMDREAVRWANWRMYGGRPQSSQIGRSGVC